MSFGNEYGFLEFALFALTLPNGYIGKDEYKIADQIWFSNTLERPAVVCEYPD